MSSNYAKQLELESSKPIDWKITRATVTACRKSFLSGGWIRRDGGPASPTTYIATFEYKVDNVRYTGRLKRGTPITLGHHFEISYNPKHPSRNTGSDYQMTWFRLIVWALWAVIAGTIIYFQHR